MTHLNSFAFDDFVVWPQSEPPDSLADYTTDTPTDRLSPGIPSVAAKDTEQDLVLLPRAFWDTFLQPKLEKLLDKKLPPNKSYKAKETNVVVSVTDRSEWDLVKRFDELDIEWPILEGQLQA
ncbi:hypothetical protein C7999DRAFT_36603 [Corynascus novoguineensis]|uniref:Uncharacterized protein n=1 Tax=Corynascus novoguineensis TaxID=1126955 RepID=A0AAN7HF94_9PEZI|nr:hypothetical protein C7999DRAFT_36603 [Corynascus novoguineensis]